MACTVSKDGAEKSIYVRGVRGEGSSFPLAYETTVLQVLENGIPVPHVYGMCEDAQAIIMDNVTGGRQMTGVTTDGKKFATYAVLQGART